MSTFSSIRLVSVFLVPPPVALLGGSVRNALEVDRALALGLQVGVDERLVALLIVGVVGDVLRHVAVEVLECRRVGVVLAVVRPLAGRLGRRTVRTAPTGRVSMISAAHRNRRIAKSPSVGWFVLCTRRLALAVAATTPDAGTATALARPAWRRNERRPTTRPQIRCSSSVETSPFAGASARR